MPKKGPLHAPKEHLIVLRGPTTDSELRKITIGAPKMLPGPVILVEYNPNWPLIFEREKELIKPTWEGGHVS